MNCAVLCLEEFIVNVGGNGYTFHKY